MPSNFNKSDLTEDEVIEYLSLFLEKEAWEIVSKALGRSHGYDIEARRKFEYLIVEAKGARGNPNNHGVVRRCFDRNQIKDHLGKAIVKILEEMAKNKGRKFCIAQPFSEIIYEVTKPIAEQLRINGILFVFVCDSRDLIWFDDRRP